MQKIINKYKLLIIRQKVFNNRNFLLAIGYWLIEFPSKNILHNRYLNFSAANSVPSQLR
ncbi:hypothetical protein D1BOALGB6SA_5698 [Olavius sp. associated proteobacterium Delta 1]|nr:hypothetical protein D1BOALGB6SA_5698 [Olavius sp. associated proteobacterium Delta 1]